MKFVIQKKDLVRELQTVTGVVEKRATLPILANLLLETTPDGLRIGASDLEVTVRGLAEATVVNEGSITLPASKLHEIARSLPEAEVQFKVLERNQVAIATVARDEAQLAFDRTKNSWDEGLVSREAYDTAFSQLNSATAQLESAEIQLA